MLPTLIFATNNTNKVTEIRAVIGHQCNIITLTEAGIYIDIPEPHDSLEANATEKAATIFKLTGKNVFSEDSGLEVMALNGEPGVKSARYAGDAKDFQRNIDKLLNKLSGIVVRSARFRTVVSLIWDKKEYQFEGICNGHIAQQQRGSMGFGYDSIFIPEGSNRSFGEMTLEEKNEFSHRKKAITQLIHFIQQQANEQDKN